ncbi:MAG: alanine racemase, partial [Mogibacterium sp.]|nr:alanine racemase [Mogibacterium sp.]
CRMGEMNPRYPAVIINHRNYRENARQIISLCADHGIRVAGVIKGINGVDGIAEDMAAAGAAMIASSRMEQLRRAKAANTGLPILLIRVPMLSEIPELIQVADISLNSEIATLEALNREALRQGRTHRVILMADLGDLREGWWFDHDELVDAAERVEKEMPGLYLEGIGTNLGCYGSIMPTEDKMLYLAELAERVEKRIGRELDVVSGGATSSLMALYDGYMPPKINMLRIGAAILAGSLEDLRTVYGYDQLEELSCETAVLQAQIIELKKKATYPVGKRGVDAFGQRPDYVDRGERMRALIAVGRADYGDITDILPVMEGVEVIGASGDHTIVDVENAAEPLQVGDILTFRLRYSGILRLTDSENVRLYHIPADA